MASIYPVEFSRAIMVPSMVVFSAFCLMREFPLFTIPVLSDSIPKSMEKTSIIGLIFVLYSLIAIVWFLWSESLRSGRLKVRLMSSVRGIYLLNAERS